MLNIVRKTASGVVLLAASLLVIPAVMALTVDDLVGVWDMNYDMGQGAQTGTITVTKGADGAPAITLNTQGGGASAAKDIKIDGDVLTFSREINAQGQSLSVSYEAQLVDGKLQGSFEIDIAGAPGAISWTAAKQ